MTLVFFVTLLRQSFKSINLVFGSITVMFDKLIKSFHWFKINFSATSNPVIFFGNEFFDAIPIKQFLIKNKIIYEKHLSIVDNSGVYESFERAKEDNRAALLTYTVGGDPDKKTSLNIFKSIAKSGVDIIECGLGHGANIGDGGAIQDSTYRALSGGIKTDDIFEIIEDFKKDYETDVIIMTYQNKIMAYGEDNFLKKCVSSKVSGIICVDWPWPLILDFAKKCKKKTISFVQLLSPTTSKERSKKNS